MITSHPSTAPHPSQIQFDKLPPLNWIRNLFGPWLLLKFLINDPVNATFFWYTLSTHRFKVSWRNLLLFRSDDITPLSHICKDKFSYLIPIIQRNINHGIVFYSHIRLSSKGWTIEWFVCCSSLKCGLSREILRVFWGEKRINTRSTSTTTLLHVLHLENTN